MVKIGSYFALPPYPGYAFSMPVAFTLIFKIVYSLIAHLAKLLVNELVSFSSSVPFIQKTVLKKWGHLPFAPLYYQTSFFRHEELSLTVYDVSGDGNCFFYSLHLCLQTIEHPCKNLSPENLREAMTDYIFNHLGSDPDIEQNLRLELSEIADQKKGELQTRLLSLEALRRQAFEKAQDRMLPQGIEFWSDVSASCFSPNTTDHELVDMIHRQTQELSYEISKPGCWVGHVALDIMAKILKIRIRVHNPAPLLPVVCELGNPFHPQVDLLRAPNHYLAIIYDKKGNLTAKMLK
ncbi:MAG: hypothetical protein EBS28_01295 [Chlamydiae bacterium]|nr:hypothetical protein [Chlamydiota bacterium]